MCIHVIFYFDNSKKTRILTVSSKCLFYLGCSQDQSDTTVKVSQGSNSWHM